MSCNISTNNLYMNGGQMTNYMYGDYPSTPLCDVISSKPLTLPRCKIVDAYSTSSLKLVGGRLSRTLENVYYVSFVLTM